MSWHAYHGTTNRDSTASERENTPLQGDSSNFVKFLNTVSFPLCKSVWNETIFCLQKTDHNKYERYLDNDLQEGKNKVKGLLDIIGNCS